MGRSSYICVETSVRTAGATCHAALVVQTRRGFMSIGEDAHARCTVALTRSKTATLMLSPLDMRGLPGMAQTLASWLHGVHVHHGPDDDRPWQPRRDENQVRGRSGSRQTWMEKLAVAGRLVWNDIPLAICCQCGSSPPEVLHLVLVRNSHSWQAQAEDLGDLPPAVLPECLTRRDEETPLSCGAMLVVTWCFRSGFWDLIVHAETLVHQINLQADSSEVQRHPRLPIAVWPVEQFRFFNEWTDAPRYSLNPVATESPDFDRPDFAPDVRDLTAFGFDAQALEETDAATRRNMVRIALSGKATWKDAAELPLDWPMALILRLVSMAHSRLRRGYLEELLMAWVHDNRAVTALPQGQEFQVLAELLSHLGACQRMGCRV